jgi:hypothetical protein
MNDKKQKESETFKAIGMLIGYALVNVTKGAFFVLGGYVVLRLVGVLQ